MLVGSLLLSGLYLVAADWELACQTWTETLTGCQEDAQWLVSYMPPIDGSSLQQQEAVPKWSEKMYEWISILGSYDICLSDNLSDINALRSSVDSAVRADPVSAQTLIEATYEAYLIWADLLFTSGQGDRLFIPRYSENSTLSDDLADVQTVMRNAFNVWYDHGTCRVVNVSQCRLGADNSSLTTDDPDLSFCGDEATERDEECDDGNYVNGDGCSSTCKIETCPAPTDIPTDIPTVIPTIIPTATKGDSGSGPTVRTTSTSSLGFGSDLPGEPITTGTEKTTAPTPHMYTSKEMPDTPEPSTDEIISDLPSVRRKRSLFCCPDDCDKEHSLKPKTKRLTNFAVQQWRAADPDTLKDMFNGLALITKAMSLLGKATGKLGKQLVKVQVQMANAAIAGLGKINENLARNQGAAIWVRITGDCCESVSCCIFWSRLTWVPIHNWYKCQPADFPGYDINDKKALGANIIDCIKAALAAKFKCDDPGGTTELIV
ncbi:uncharacterized protein LOC134196808 [Corticium candelabrum]|uniref:uncharacterized protein LOC134196808 n=1 Tax=Corticium candelabrum TaxID=121492 RepID=UPI002E261D00|nr:uncharacterized protein LOC134196808 [Corticium candelabrum]